MIAAELERFRETARAAGFSACKVGVTRMLRDNAMDAEADPHASYSARTVALWFEQLARATEAMSLPPMFSDKEDRGGE